MHMQKAAEFAKASCILSFCLATAWLGNSSKVLLIQCLCVIHDI